MDKNLATLLTLINYIPAKTLQSSDAGLLEVTRSSHKKIGDAAFVNYVPKLWNTLPINIREANTLDIFILIPFYQSI